MGEISEMILDGILCQYCGVLVNKEGCLCKICYDNNNRNMKSDIYFVIAVVIALAFVALSLASGNLLKQAHKKLCLYEAEYCKKEDLLKRINNNPKT